MRGKVFDFSDLRTPSTGTLSAPILRQLFLARALAFFAGYGFIALPLSLARAVVTGWQPLYTLHALMFAGCAIAFLTRAHLGERSRAAIVMTVLTTLAMAGVLTFGLGSPVFFTCALLAAGAAGHLYGMRAGLAASAAFAAMIAATGYAFTFGLITPPISLDAMNASAVFWLQAALLVPLQTFACLVLLLGEKTATQGAMVQIQEVVAALDHADEAIGIHGADHTLRYANQAYARLVQAESPASLLGHDPVEFFRPTGAASQDAMRRFSAASAQGHAAAVLEVQTAPGGQRRIIDARTTRVSPERHIAFIRDVTEIRRELDTQDRLYSAISELAAEEALFAGLQQACQSIADKAASALDVELVYVWRTGPDQKQWHKIAWHAPSGSVGVIDMTLPEEADLVQRLTAARVLALDDATAETGEGAAYRAALHRDDVRSVMAVGAVRQSRLMGSIAIRTARRRHWTIDEKRFAAHLGDLLALALERDALRTAEQAAREARDRLSENEARLNRVLEASGEGWWERDFLTDQVIRSPAWYRMLGYQPSDLPDTAEGLHLVHPDDRAYAAALHEQAIRSGTRSFEVTYRLRAKSGEYVPVSSRILITRDDAGRPRLLSGTNQDLREIKANQDQLGRILEASNDGWVEWDIAHNRVQRSRRWSEILGHDKEPLPEDQLMWDMIHPDDRPAVDAAFQQALTSRDRFDCEFRCMAKSGEAIPVFARFSIGRDANKQPIRLTAMLTDLRTIKANEERLNRVLESTNDGWWEWDLDSNTVIRSSRWRQMFSYQAEPAAAPSKGWLAIHPDDRPHVQAAFEAAVQSGAPGFHCDFRHLCGDGSFVPVTSRVLISRDSNGKPVRLSGMMTDLRERKAIEERLRESQKMEAIGQLTGGIAHDFNNILGVLAFTTEEMLEEDRSETDQVRLNRILSSIFRGADLTNRLLAFARKQALKPEALEVDSVFSELTALCRRTLGATIAIETAIAPGTRRVFADASQLHTALLNLALNARDAMATGGRLTFLARNCESRARTGPRSPVGEAFVELTVTDTGTGMSPDVLARATEPFFTTKEAGKGTGLGLSMVYGFAEQSGGWVDLTSAPGQGTSVRLVLPAASSAGSTQPAGSGEPAPAFPVAPGKVLIVEDEPGMRAVAVERFRQWGFTVIEAADGKQAMQALESAADLQLLFSDITLPGRLTGRDIAQAAVERIPGVRVLLTSGYQGDHVDPGESFTVLQKPYRRARLVAAVQDVLSTPSAATPTRARH